PASAGRSWTRCGRWSRPGPSPPGSPARSRSAGLLRRSPCWNPARATARSCSRSTEAVQYLEGLVAPDHPCLLGLDAQLEHLGLKGAAHLGGVAGREVLLLDLAVPAQALQPQSAVVLEGTPQLARPARGRRRAGPDRDARAHRFGLVVLADPPHQQVPAVTGDGEPSGLSAPGRALLRQLPDEAGGGQPVELAVDLLVGR